MQRPVINVATATGGRVNAWRPHTTASPSAHGTLVPILVSVTQARKPDWTMRYPPRKPRDTILCRYFLPRLKSARPGTGRQSKMRAHAPPNQTCTRHVSSAQRCPRVRCHWTAVADKAGGAGSRQPHRRVAAYNE